MAQATNIAVDLQSLQDTMTKLVPIMVRELSLAATSKNDGNAQETDQAELRSASALLDASSPQLNRTGFAGG